MYVEDRQQTLMGELLAGVEPIVGRIHPVKNIIFILYFGHFKC